MKTENGYAYCARHGEYLPSADLITDEWYADFIDENGNRIDDEGNPIVRPEWVTPDLIEDGFGPNDEGEPEGELYIRFECDEAGLMDRIRSLFAEVEPGPGGADDDTFDYWPSGVLLLLAMIGDLTAPAFVAECAGMPTALADVLRETREGFADEILENLGL